MRIRFFNTFEPVSYHYRDLLPALAEAGFEVEVVISGVEYRADRSRLEENVQHSNIHFHRVSAGPGWMKGRSYRPWVILSYIFGAMLRSLFGRPVDLNYFFTQPPLFAVWGYILKLFRGQPYICQVMDLYPDAAIQNGLLKEDGIPANILTRISRFALRKADAVIVIGRFMGELFQREGVPENRIAVIQNWANESELHRIPAVDNKLRKEWGIDEDFVILYSGNMGVSHHFDDILESARRLHDVPAIRFVFVGDGVRRQEIEQAKVHFGLNNLLLVPFQPIERFSESLSAGDVHFVCLRPGFEGLVVPSKAYSALAIGKPIIYQGVKDGEIARMIAEERIGTVLPTGDAAMLTRTILNYYENPQLVREEGARALEVNNHKYSRDRAIGQYLTLLHHFDARMGVRPAETE